MAEAPDICATVSPREIPNRNINNSEAQGNGREYELEITKRIKIAKILAPSYDSFIIVPGQ